MGHHSIKVTVDIYGHLVPGANRGAVDRLDVTGRNSRATGTAGDQGGCDRSGREEMVELRGVGLEGCFVSATEDELLALPSSGRGRR
jgi:hypothetical protein